MTPWRKTLSWGSPSETNWDSISPDFISFMLSEKNTVLSTVWGKTTLEVIEIIGIGKREKEEIYKLIVRRLVNLG